jgi:DNA polymerase-1
VDLLLREDTFVIDLETNGLDTQTNEMLWCGLGCTAHTFLIPCGHPKGHRLTVQKKEKTPASLLWSDERGLTPTGKPSMRMVEHLVPATYAPPPRQLYPYQVAELIEPLLFSDRAKLNHHLKFDLQTIAKYFGGRIPPGPYHDTLVLQHVIDESLPMYGLKELSIDWFRPADRKKWYPSLGTKGVENFGLDEIASYLNKDLVYTRYLYKRLWPKLIKRGLKAVYDFEMSMYPVLMDMESAGFPIDLSAMEKVGEELTTSIAQIEKDVGQLVGDEIPMSNLSVKRYVLFGEVEKGKEIPVGTSGHPLKPQGLTPLNRTAKTDAAQLNKALLERYASSNEVARLFLEWSAYEKLRGTFVVGFDKYLSKRDSGLPRLHTSFKQHGTVTGRFSAEKPNLHQIPKSSVIRELFIAGPGHVLIVADYDQVELRCAGYESGDPNMLTVFKRGDDVHRQAAAAMWNIPLDKVTEEQRAVGKTQNFAIIYGAGVNKIAYVAKCSKRRAQKLIDGYYEMFGGLEPWKKRVLAEARDRCDPASPSTDPPTIIIPPIGRLRRLPDLMKYHKEEEWMRWRAERQAINALVQGFASYITKIAMLNLYQRISAYPAQMVLQVHDEIIVRCEEAYAEEVLALVSDTMTGVTDLSGSPILGEIPLIVSSKIGYSWAAAKKK